MVDVAHASEHDYDFCLKLKNSFWENRLTCEIFSTDEVNTMIEQNKKDLLLRSWLNKLENACREQYPQVLQKKDGFWVNAHMFYHKGQSVQEAAQNMGRIFPEA
jgi:hypothetical protein